MPLFFLLSGYCFSKASFVKDSRRLLLPYVVMCAAYFAFEISTDTLQHFMDHTWYILRIFFWGMSGYNPVPRHGELPLIGPIWFLLAMFWCRQYLHLLKKGITNKWALLATCAVISCVTGYIDHEVMRLPMGVLEGGNALVFFCIGYILKGTDLMQYRWWYLLIALGIWVADAMQVWCLDLSTGLFKTYPLAVAGACSASYLIYVLSNYIKKATALAAALRYIGVMTMPIFCFHALQLREDFLLPGSDTLYWLSLFLMPIAASWLMARWKVTRFLFGM